MEVMYPVTCYTRKFNCLEIHFQAFLIQRTICCHLPKAVGQCIICDKKFMMRDFAKKLPKNEHKNELVCSAITEEK